jgi:NADPH:quinone reductase-like Zn-dependent oxidoreductase
MKAAICTRYGSPDVIQIAEVEKPAPKDHEVLIRVLAASVNPLDWHLKRGNSYFLRPMTGFRKPRNPRIGVDVAGQVEAVGPNVTEFKPGDAVFGTCEGAFAEYVCASERTLATKPDNMTFEQAAAAPIAALTALQGLRDKGKIQPGQKVLINGASGGVGTFTVQIAKAFGAGVTGVCSTKNADMVRSLGAERVIDYTREDFTKDGQRYDLIFDLVGNHSFSACRRVLNPRGIHLAAGALSERAMTSILARMVAALVLSGFVSQKFVMFIAEVNKRDLTVLHDLMKAGKVTPVIDKRYTLNEVPQAIRYLEERHARGKLVINLNDADEAG